MSAQPALGPAPVTEAGQFLYMLYGEHPPGFLVLCTLEGRGLKAHAGPAINWANAGRRAEEWARTKDVYFGIGLQRERPAGDDRGKADGVIAIPGLWIDIDILGPAHKETRLPPDLDSALRLLSEAIPLEPTVIVHSGNGIHAWWLFNELWEFDSEEERKEAAALSRQFQATIRAKAQHYGWKVDNTSDLARVLRLPGTWNRKREPTKVKILHQDNSKRYNPHDFEPYLMDPEAMPDAGAGTNGGAQQPGPPLPPADLGRITEGCAWMRHCRDDAATLPEPEWYAMLSIIGRCENGEALAHEWSKAYPGYSPAETEAKLQQALGTAGPRTCADIRGIGGEEYCKACPHWGFITSPINLGTMRRSRTDLPKIDATQGDLAHMAEEAWEAVKAANDPPELFQRGGLITRIQIGDSGEPRLTVVTRAGLRGILARVAWWYKWQKGPDGKSRPTDAMPPLSVVDDMLAAPGFPLPIIARVVEAPVFGRNGELELQPGYHPASRTYYWDSGLMLPPVAELRPSYGEIERAKKLLLEELLGDFPFTSEAERAHALACLLLPFAREMVPGPTPLHLIEAPSPGTGKSLLADAIAIPATGRPANTMAEGRDEDEWRKRITAALVAAPTFLLIDNLRRKLDSAALSAALTSQSWQDRILGRTELTTLPVRTTWMATGNNPALTTEMARRVVRIRVDAKTARPWTREGFRHPDLRSWALRNRADLVWAALTLIKTWVYEGMPPGEYVLGQYEAWARTMGGILDCIGVEGFLGNLDEVYSAADEETAQWEEFFTTWWDMFGEYPKAVGDLWKVAEEKDLLLFVRGDGSERSQKIRMGRALGQMRDRQVGRWRMVQAGKDGRNKTAMYQLVQVAGDVHQPVHKEAEVADVAEVFPDDDDPY